MLRGSVSAIAIAAALTALPAQAMAKHHMLVISLDGLGSAYLNKADEYHLKIPTLRQFMREGVYASGVTGVLPTLTYPSHTTLMTGVCPVEQGVYANQKFDLPAHSTAKPLPRLIPTRPRHCGRPHTMRATQPPVSDSL